MVATIRCMEVAFFLMKLVILSASLSASGTARDPPGWKSFWQSIRRSVVIVWRNVCRGDYDRLLYVVDRSDRQL